MNQKKFEVDTNSYAEIADIIGSDQSPVGIDAKKTHIIILHKLDEINQRMIRIENLLNQKK